MTRGTPKQIAVLAAAVVFLLPPCVPSSLLSSGTADHDGTRSPGVAYAEQLPLTPETLAVLQELRSAPSFSEPSGSRAPVPPLPLSAETVTAPPALQSSPSATVPSCDQLPFPAPTPPEKPGEGGGQTFIDVLHGHISQEIFSTADWMDSFFADENYVKETNRSYVRFRYDIFKEETSPATFKPAVDLRLALPELERKTHLVFSAEPNEPLSGPNAPVRTAAERFGATEEANLKTALQYIFKATPQESFLVLSGLQFSKNSPVIFFEPRYRILFPYAVWQVRFTQEVLWRTDTAWQTDTRFEFERPLPKDFFFRTTVDGVWASRVLGYTYSLAFLLREPFGPTYAVDYEWINTYQTEPVGELTEIDFRVRFRHSFWREWLFFEVAPQVRFPRSSNFDRIPGVLFRLEMFFGRTAG